MPMDDFVYVVTPFSVCLIRLEKNRVNEIQTLSAAIAISDNFSKDTLKPFQSESSKTERSTLNYTVQELKLDQTTRIMPLPGHRVLVCDQNGNWQMLALKFDQADLDVAEVNFIPISHEDKITPSRIAITWT